MSVSELLALMSTTGTAQWGQKNYVLIFEFEFHKFFLTFNIALKGMKKYPEKHFNFKKVKEL